ncbi:MAG: hypothetical protein WC836_01960 [Desulfobacula sp.]|jgi:hypothetical protein
MKELEIGSRIRFYDRKNHHTIFGAILSIENNGFCTVLTSNNLKLEIPKRLLVSQDAPYPIGLVEMIEHAFNDMGNIQYLNDPGNIERANWIFEKIDGLFETIGAHLTPGKVKDLIRKYQNENALNPL